MENEFSIRKDWKLTKAIENTYIRDTIGEIAYLTKCKEQELADELTNSLIDYLSFLNFQRRKEIEDRYYDIVTDFPHLYDMAESENLRKVIVRVGEDE